MKLTQQWINAYHDHIAFLMNKANEHRDRASAFALVNMEEQAGYERDEYRSFAYQKDRLETAYRSCFQKDS